MGSENVHVQHDPRGCGCCRSGDDSLRTADLVQTLTLQVRRAERDRDVAMISQEVSTASFKRAKANLLRVSPK